ncbi:putative axonemal dynein light chain domain-containing protein 1 [Triplophysa rosa]|uniref:Axonemal dynein light chain domain-containing protein 1 n=1 Tax=Triplophysa rosa TaxID=992332 RepID=A0A9W7T5T7_TRIRA|nr:putative axonemal dynein light chain domain-containing protein 1 [Triplophysa rosa]
MTNSQRREQDPLGERNHGEQDELSTTHEERENAAPVRGIVLPRGGGAWWPERERSWTPTGTLRRHRGEILKINKLQLVKRLNVIEQTWAKTAEHFTLVLTTKDSEDLSHIIELTDQWKENLTTFMENLRKTESSQRETIQSVRAHVVKWQKFCEDQIRRHPASDGGPPKGQEAMGELSKTITELHKQLGIRINGGSGIHATLMSLSDNMEFWSRSLKSRSGPELHPSGDWVKMEEALGSLRNLLVQCRQRSNHKSVLRSFICSLLRSLTEVFAMYSGKFLVPDLEETLRLIKKERRSRHPVRKAWRRVFGERKWKRKVSACDEDYSENVVWEHHSHQGVGENIYFIGPLQNPEVAWESSEDDWFLQAHPSMESLYNKAISTDVFVTAHQSLESLYKEELSTDEKVSRSAQTSDCQIEEPKNPPSTMKRRAKAIKAYFNKKWKAVKRTFTQCTGDSDS